MSIAGFLLHVAHFFWLCFEPLAIAADDVPHLASSCDETDDPLADSALVALQTLARKTQITKDELVIRCLDMPRGVLDTWTKLNLTKLRRLQSRREPASSGLIGAAWSDFAVEVVVGEQIFPVIVDTGSSTFAVPARPVAGCQSFYTGVCEGRALEARYGSANWTGRVCFGPEVEVAGLGAGRISFAGIFAQNNFLTECTSIPGGFVSRGIIGMAYPELLPQGLTTTLWDSLVAKNGIQNVFAMQCCPWNGLNRGTGSLTLGGWDEQLYNAEDFVHTKITMEKWFCIGIQEVFVDGFASEELGAGPEECSQNPVGSCILADCQDPSSTCDMPSLACRCKAGKCNYFGQCVDSHQPSLFQINPANHSLGHNHSGGKQDWSFNDIINWFKRIFGGSTERCKGIVDSGTSSLVLPKDVFDNVLNALNKVASAWQIRGSCLSQSEVDLFPDLIIRLDSANSDQPFFDLRIPPSTYFQLDPGATCRTLYIRSSGTLNGGLGNIPDYILGQPLLEAYYTVFDKEKRRISFAPLKGC